MVRAYDNDGELTSFTYPSGEIYTHNTDALGCISQILSGTDVLAEYMYLGSSRVARRGTNNGLVWMRYDYDAYGRIEATEHQLSGTGLPDDPNATVFSMGEYRWYENNNKKERHWWRGAVERKEEYEYDFINRLERRLSYVGGQYSGAADYDYDDLSNRNSTGYTLDNQDPPADRAMNQYTTTPGDVMDRLYDERGNMTREGQGGQMYYDAAGHLTHVVTDDGTNVYFSYDALGRRILKSIVPYGGATETTRFVYDGDRVVEEYDAAGQCIADYLYGNYIDEVLRMRRDTDATAGLDAEYWYQHDDMFDVMSLTNAAGAVVERYEYEDFGKSHVFDASWTELTKSAVYNPYRFTGRRWDDEIQLYYFRARYMDPALGRFITRDPLGIWGDTANMGNAYTYAASNPWSRVDPFGLASGGNQKAFYDWNSDGTIDGDDWEYQSHFGSKAEAIAAASEREQENPWLAGAWEFTKSAVSSAANELTFGYVGTSAVDQAREFGDENLIRWTQGFQTVSDVASVLSGSPRQFKELASLGRRGINAIGDLRSGVHNGFEYGITSCSNSLGRIPHGNSLSSKRPQHVYQILNNKTQTVEKIGISGGRLNKNGTSRRANSQINRLNRKFGEGSYSAQILQTDLPDRRSALEMEKRISESYRSFNVKLNRQKRP